MNTPPSLPGQPRRSSLAGGVASAWLVMVVGEILVIATSWSGWVLGGMLLPPIVVIVWGMVMLGRNDGRFGKGLLLGLASVFAVALLLVAACFGMFFVQSH